MTSTDTKQKTHSTEERVETDAVHPRFQSRENLLFICPNCDTKKPTEVRIQRHFLKKKCFPVHSACTLCGGLVFYYKFGCETRLTHDCKKWAEYSKKNNEFAKDWISESEVSSIAESVSTECMENSQSTGF